ncbi:thioredoxin family protein [Leptolyngbya sp. 7M]|uniref:thioredoxin family protein n=1 Tax=Leptolyngbya sp. 7M TaxID=2812896 RepID=UPI001B8ADA1A|nr:thioredoxin family protein [Leptolyngbya sp. 7M]QYO63226.1 thioredoxin family protein [Leptolyngbya sp. 7M]
MAATETTQIPLGFRAPNFTLPDAVSGREMSLNELKGENATVVMFICNHCPFVKHVNAELVRLANDYMPKGVSFIAINSNDIENYPEDSPENMKMWAERLGYPFPYLFDETQDLARAYHAACTPDFSIFDKDLLCVYRGQLDGSRPGNNVTNDGRDIRAALDNILAGRPVSSDQRPSLGCNIKWKGNRRT